MKENSIEEDRKILEKLINTMKSDRELFDEKTDKEIYTFFINALEHILSDYKRVLKENEQLSTEVNSLKEDNEELKEENFNLQCIAKQYIELYEKYKKLYERSIR